MFSSGTDFRRAGSFPYHSRNQTRPSLEIAALPVTKRKRVSSEIIQSLDVGGAGISSSRGTVRPPESCSLRVIIREGSPPRIACSGMAEAIIISLLQKMHETATFLSG